MKKIIQHLPDLKLIGITCRTNNASEMAPETAKIASMVKKYFQEHIADTIPHRKRPNITYSVYTEYVSDFTGDYTYFFGEEVDSIENCPEGLNVLIIPSQNYMKFTNGPGKMPDVCIQAWQKIWMMKSDDLGAERAYIADFEVYDERSADPMNTILDIFVGIK